MDDEAIASAVDIARTHRHIKHVNRIRARRVGPAVHIDMECSITPNLSIAGEMPAEHCDAAHLQVDRLALTNETPVTNFGDFAVALMLACGAASNAIGARVREEIFRERPEVSEVLVHFVPAFNLPKEPHATGGAGAGGVSAPAAVHGGKAAGGAGAAASAGGVAAPGCEPGGAVCLSNGGNEVTCDDHAAASGKQDAMGRLCKHAASCHTHRHHHDRRHHRHHADGAAAPAGAAAADAHGHSHGDDSHHDHDHDHDHDDDHHDMGVTPITVEDVEVRASYCVGGLHT